MQQIALLCLLDLCIYTAGGGNPLYREELLKQCSSVKNKAIGLIFFAELESYMHKVDVEANKWRKKWWKPTEKCPKSAIFHPLAWIPAFQARVSGPRFRPAFQARVLGPRFRPAFQARKLGHCSALQVKPENRLEHIWGPTSLHINSKLPSTEHKYDIWRHSLLTWF